MSGDFENDIGFLMHEIEKIEGDHFFYGPFQSLSLGIMVPRMMMIVMMMVRMVMMVMVMVGMVMSDI